MHPARPNWWFGIWPGRSDEDHGGKQSYFGRDARPFGRLEAFAAPSRQ